MKLIIICILFSTWCNAQDTTKCFFKIVDTINKLNYKYIRGYEVMIEDGNGGWKRIKYLDEKKQPIILKRREKIFYIESMM